jgi:hypothetical protein
MALSPCRSRRTHLPRSDEAHRTVGRSFPRKRISGHLGARRPAQLPPPHRGSADDGSQRSAPLPEAVEIVQEQARSLTDCSSPNASGARPITHPLRLNCTIAVSKQSYSPASLPTSALRLRPAPQPPSALTSWWSKTRRPPAPSKPTKTQLTESSHFSAGYARPLKLRQRWPSRHSKAVPW